MLICRRSFARRSFMRNSVLLLSLAVALSACGLKGPLYLPKDKPGAAPPAAAAPADEKKAPAPAAP